ncbi:anti-sigma factor family protein [Bradyrhizobium sp.]
MKQIAMISPRMPTSSMSTAGPCSEWELALHAFFDGELDAADALTCEQHLERCQRCSAEMKSLKSMRLKFTRSALGWAAPDALRNRIG